MRKKAFVAVAALAVMFYTMPAFAAAGTCQDWLGVWNFTYDNGTTPTSFCFYNTSVIDNGTIVACENDLIDHCTCIENISTTAPQLCIDTVAFTQCDSDLIINCKCVINPVYKKLSVAKGTYEVKITDVRENYSAGPITELCFATGKRGTQDITISQPDNATLNNIVYKKYFRNVQKGMYMVQEAGGQSVASAPFARIRKANFLSDNFTVEIAGDNTSKYWNIQGLIKGEFVRELSWLEANFKYEVSGAGNVTITRYMGAGGAVVIPDTIDGKPVVSIGDFAFSGESTLTSITIPSSVTSLGDYAFYHCTRLTTAFFYGNAPYMGVDVFDECASGFIVYYIAGSTGFANPWCPLDNPGYPTTVFTPSSTTTTTPGATTTTTTMGGSTTTTITISAIPCPAKKALGEDNPKLENLRDFRDSKLANSIVGRKAIQIYYNNADTINAALERSPALQAVARRALEVIAPMVGKKE